MTYKDERAYRINVSSYQKWQKSTDKAKDWVSLSTNFFSDNAIVDLMADCPDAVFCFQWLIMNADNQGVIELKEANLKRALMRVTGSQSNRFDVLKRLELIANNGLITFQIIPKEPLINSQNTSNPVLNDSQSISNTPLDTPQTPSLTDPLTTTITTTLKENPPTPQRGEAVLSKEEKTKFKETHVVLAKIMAIKIKEVVPLAKIPENFDRWAHTLRLIEEIDKISLRDVQDVFIWANKDTFWGKNILCPEALRRQIGRLHAKMVEDRDKADGTQKDSRPYAVKLLDSPRIKHRYNDATYPIDAITVDPTCKRYGNKGSITVKATGEEMSAEEWVGVG